MDVLIAVLLVSIGILVGWLIFLTYQTHAQLKRIMELIWTIWPGALHHAHGTMTNYSTWKYSGGAWRLVEQRLQPGFVAADSPKRPGAYEDETVRVAAIRAQ